MFVRKMLTQVVIIFMLGAGFAVAQEQVSYTPSVLVVDVKRVLGQSKAAQSLKEQLDQAAARLTESYAKREEKIREDQKALIEARASISEEEFNKRRVEIEAAIVALRDDRNNDRRSIDAAADKGRQVIANEVKKISTEIASKKGANMVIERALVIVMAEDFDITDQLLVALDEVLPELTLTEKKASE